jgi:hypothetical protein
LYSEYLPPQIRHERIREILCNHVKGDEVYQKTTLTDATVDVIINFFYGSDGDSVVTFYRKISKKKQFTHLIRGEYHALREPINIIGSVAKVNFLIATLSEYLGFSRRKAQKDKWFTINGEAFIADYCDADYSRLHLSNPIWVNAFMAAFSKTLE